MAYKLAIGLESLWDGEKVSLKIAGVPVLLVRLDGEIYAYEDRCPHLRVSFQAGRLEGEQLVCGAHHWRYDVCTGHGLHPQGVSLKSLPIKICEGQIYVHLPQEA